MNIINNDLNNKYINGKIYIIYSLNSNKAYFGSTTRTINERLKEHIRYYNGYKKGKYKYCNSTCDMFDDLDVKNCKVKLIKNYPCGSKKDLEKEEGKFIVSSKNCYNKYVAGRTNKEYYNKYTDTIKQYKKKYYKSNIDTIKEQKKEYYKSNIDTIKEQNKKYKDDHAVEIKQYINQYTKDNADKLKQKINCECGGKHTYANTSIHLKSIKHQKYLILQN